MVKIAPSILSADFANLERDIRLVDEKGADYIHVDVMDGQFVPNITLGANIVSAIRPVTDLPLDVHLMVQEPERFIEDFAKAGSDIITVHQESTVHIHRAMQMIKNAGGLAILAHPVYITEDYDKLYSLLKQLKEYGLDGTECLYNCYSEEFSKMCFDICDKLGLVKSGGSDFHGGNKPDVELGKVSGGYVPYEFLLNMKEQRGLM